MSTVNPVDFDQFSYLDRLIHVHLFRLVGNIRANAPDQPQFFDTTMPPHYEAPHLRELRTPARFDLQSAAALACTSTRLRAAWREVQISDLAAHLQALVRGHAIRFIIGVCEDAEMRIGDDGRVVSLPGESWLVLDDGYIDLAEMMERADKTRCQGAITRPRGWTDEDCLLVALDHACCFAETLWAPIVANAVVSKFKSYAAALVAVKQLAGANTLNEEAAAYAVRRTTPSIAALIGIRRLLQALGEQDETACPFVWLRKQFACGVQPALPRALFERDMLSQSLSDISRQHGTRPFADTHAYAAIAEWRSFIAWLIMRQAGSDVVVMRRWRHSTFGRSTASQGDLWEYNIENSDLFDSLFRTESSRYYHTDELKLSRFGIVSASDALVQTILRNGMRVRAVLESAPHATAAVLEFLAGKDTFDERWLAFAVEHQFYLATIARDPKISADTVLPAPRIELRSLATNAYPDDHAVGRVLARIWRTIYGVVGHDVVCDTRCALSRHTLGSVMSSIAAFVETPKSLAYVSEMMPRVMFAVRCTPTSAGASTHLHEVECWMLARENDPCRAIAVRLMSFRACGREAWCNSKICGKWLVDWHRVSAQPTQYLVGNCLHRYQLQNFSEATWRTPGLLDCSFANRSVISSLAEQSSGRHRTPDDPFTMADAQTLFQTAQHHLTTILTALDDAATFAAVFRLGKHCALCTPDNAIDDERRKAVCACATVARDCMDRFHEARGK